MMEPDRRGLFSGSLILLIAGIGLIVVIVLVVAMTCGSGSDKKSSVSPTPQATQTAADPSDPSGALTQYVETTLKAKYAGDCSSAQTGSDAGKICSTKLGERESIQAYVLGQTLSQGLRWVFLESRGGAWQVLASPEMTPDNRQVPGVPWPLKVGAEVVITGTGSCLNVRTEPGGAAVDCIAEGAKIKLSAGPRTANNLEWWQVEGRNGWVAADFLRYPDATKDPTPAPRPSSTPSASPSATPRP
jgi:hypothetical protein